MQTQTQTQTEEVIELDDANTIDRNITNVQANKRRVVPIEIDHALNKSTQCNEIIEGHKFRCVYPTIICQPCNELFGNSKLVVGKDEYYDFFMNSNC